MQTKGLKHYIEQLSEKQEITKIKEYVNPELEITEFADRIMKQENGGKALIFENNGTNFPLLINHYGSDKRILQALGISSYEEPSNRIDKLMSKVLNPNNNFKSKLALLPQLKEISNWLPKKTKGKAECQQVVHHNPNLSIFPILKCWPFDGGKFITLPIVITEDPETGIRNMGMYRMQIFDNTTCGMHWHLHKGGATHYNKYKAFGKKMPVTVILGGDPALAYAATAPLPENIDELLLVGFLKNQKVKLVKSLTNDIYIPASSDIVIEGYIDPEEDFRKEGPFGDHTGFYSLDDLYPVFHVTCITHRKDAVYPATIVGIPPMEDYYIGKATEKIFLKPIQISIAPEIIDLRLPGYGIAHNLVFIKTKTHYPGQNIKIMNALLGAGQMMFSKVIVCFNENVDIQNDNEVLNVINNNFNVKNIIIGKGPSDVLDHSAYQYTISGKLLIDLSQEQNNINQNKISEHINYISPSIGIVKTENLKNTDFTEQIDEIKNMDNIDGLKIIAITDNFVELDSAYLYAWYILNNIDPTHDCLIKDNKLYLNACIKNKKDGFHRRWPNPVIMDDKTIEIIDEKWDKLTNIPFVKSPSIKTKHLQQGDIEIVKPEFLIKN